MNLINEENEDEKIKKEFEYLLSHGTEFEIMYGLIGIGMYLNDYNYVINICKKLIIHENSTILRGIIFAIGHLGRNFDNIDIIFYNFVIDKGLKSYDKVTVDAAQNLMNDFDYILV